MGLLLEQDIIVGGQIGDIGFESIIGLLEGRILWPEGLVQLLDGFYKLTHAIVFYFKHMDLLHYFSQLLIYIL